MKKTFYLAIEGGDGSGKSTLVKKLHQHFLDQGLTVLLTKEFGSPHNQFCQDLRDFALNSKYSVDEKAGQILFGSIIQQHQEKVIKPALGKFDIILSDRGPYSNYCYGPVHGLSEKWIKSFFDLVYDTAEWPHLSLFIHTPPELAEARRIARTPENFKDGGVDRIEAKGTKFQLEVIQNFVETAQNDTRLQVLNVNKDMNPDDVLSAALAIINLQKSL